MCEICRGIAGSAGRSLCCILGIRAKRLPAITASQDRTETLTFRNQMTPRLKVRNPILRLRGMRVDFHVACFGERASAGSCPTFRGFFMRAHRLRQVMQVSSPMYRPCRNCGEKVPLALSECPYCGSFAPAAGMFGRGHRRIVLLSVVVILGLLLASAMTLLR
jgi:hypothetical protein